MPYASKAQQGLFHSPNSPVGPDVVAKFDRESKGVHGLPEHSKGGKMKHNPKAAALHHIKGLAHGALMDRMKKKRMEIDAISPAHQQEAEADEGDEDEMMKRLVQANQG